MVLFGHILLRNVLHFYQVVYIRAGVLAGKSEEVVDGFVWQNNPHGIKASWKGLDPESGVVNYQVSVGTSPGCVYFHDA